MICVEIAMACKYTPAIRYLYGETTAERVTFVLTFLKIRSPPPPPTYHRRCRITLYITRLEKS